MRLGKYQLLRKLATGGMAEVFLAKTDGPMGFEKMLVIKRILPHLAEDPRFVEMFLGEAKLAARLNHPNLVQLFDFGEAEGSYFIAMEYIDGPTLRLLLARSRDLRSPLSLTLAARIVSSAAEGLAYAHDYRDPVTDEPLHLIHRDVSPDNILLSRSGAVKLVDFGIAKARGQSHHTQAGTVKGKVAYMAPEQLRGEPLDRRVDLYSLGVVLYELCTGRMPFEANSDASMVRSVLYDAAIPAVKRVPTLPRTLQSILERLLVKDRNSRYPDCRALHADLEAFIQSTREATNGFALSRLVAHLAPPPPLQPVQPASPRATGVPPGVTASAFAPTSSSPILRSEPVAGGGAAAAPAALEILDLDRTVRSEPRRMPPPPVANLEVRPAANVTPGPSPSAFVFPTALEKERGSVAPVRLGLDRTEGRRRTTTGTTRRVRTSGGGLRALGVVLLFLGLAVVGAYLGLAVAHRTDLLGRVGLPVPAALGPAPASVPPAVTAPGPSAEPAPVAKTSPGAEGGAPGTGTPTPAGAGPAVAMNPPSPPPAGPSTPAVPAAPAGTPPRPSDARSSASARPASADPAATGATSGSASGAGAPAQSGRAGERGVAAGAGVAAGTAARAAPSAGGAEASEPRAAEEQAPVKDTRTESKPAPTASRESDREKLLGAFAQLESAKESTVRLESTPRMRVRMGGKILGTTPIPLTVAAQEAPLELEFFDPALGLSKTEQLTLKPGDNGTHRVVIPKGKLVLKLQDGVSVSVDGKSAGTTPLAPLSLYQGEHTVQLTRGEQKERRTLEISGEEPTELEFSFPEEE